MDKKGCPIRAALFLCEKTINRSLLLRMTRRLISGLGLPRCFFRIGLDGVQRACKNSSNLPFAAAEGEAFISDCVLNTHGGQDMNRRWDQFGFIPSDLMVGLLVGLDPYPNGANRYSDVLNSWSPSGWVGKPWRNSSGIGKRKWDSLCRKWKGVISKKLSSNQ